MAEWAIALPWQMDNLAARAMPIADPGARATTRVQTEESAWSTPAAGTTNARSLVNGRLATEHSLADADEGRRIP